MKPSLGGFIKRNPAGFPIFLLFGRPRAQRSPGLEFSDGSGVSPSLSLVRRHYVFEAQNSHGYGHHVLLGAERRIGEGGRPALYK